MSPAPFSTTAFAAAKAAATTLANRPFRIGIVGGGPAGFYTAARLLGLPGSEETRVDLFELLPVPFGLSRFGVAPDHPEVKNCEHKFEETARDPRFRFFGNVAISGDSSPPHPTALSLPLSSLKPHYDAIILSYGASLDRSLDIPGEGLSNVLSARDFVNYYNGHPYASALLAPLLDLSNVEHVTIIGQGNVALDVARLLLKSVDELAKTDLPEYALEELGRSRVKRVEVVGRRGPLELACTTKELREMMALEDVSFETDQGLLRGAQEMVEMDPSMNQARMRKRALGLLESGSKDRKEGATKSWSLEFLQSPVRIVPTTVDGTQVGSIEFELNQLVASEGGAARAVGTGRKVVRKTDMVMKSVGYRSVGLAGLPFDERKGIMRNIDGRVVSEDGETIRGLYTSGWLARGPNGVIATTMFDAFATADLVASDLSSHPPTSAAPPLPIEALRGSKQVVSWEDWERIDNEERKRGRASGKVREKMTDVAQMFAFLN